MTGLVSFNISFHILRFSFTSNEKIITFASPKKSSIHSFLNNYKHEDIPDR